MVPSGDHAGSEQTARSRSTSQSTSSCTDEWIESKMNMSSPIPTAILLLSGAHPMVSSTGSPARGCPSCESMTSSEPCSPDDVTANCSPSGDSTALAMEPAGRMLQKGLQSISTATREEMLRREFTSTRARTYTPGGRPEPGGVLAVTCRGIRSSVAVSTDPGEGSEMVGWGGGGAAVEDFVAAGRRTGEQEDTARAMARRPPTGSIHDRPEVTLPRTASCLSLKCSFPLGPERKEVAFAIIPGLSEDP